MGRQLTAGATQTAARQDDTIPTTIKTLSSFFKVQAGVIKFLFS